LKGNILTPEEKEIRLKRLREEIRKGKVDKEMIPYLKRINRLSFICTTQSCSGHNEDPKKGRWAHIDFRSALNESETIRKILQPLEAKREHPDIAYEIMIERYGIRYCLWLDNKKWREQMEDLISVLENVENEIENKST